MNAQSLICIHTQMPMIAGLLSLTTVCLSIRVESGIEQRKIDIGIAMAQATSSRDASSTELIKGEKNILPCGCVSM